MNTVNANTIPMLPFCEEILKEKYLKNHETTADEIYQRVAKGIAQAENEYNQEAVAKEFYENMKAGGIGAGRIMSSAGTGIKASLLNCFVQPVGDTISGYDSEGNPGIYTALEKAAETMRMGGGVGYNFSKIRPYGAWIKSTQSMASGPCSYMDVFDASCMTVESLGCFTGDTLIHTTQGLLPIKQIVESSEEFYAVTHLGPKRVTTKFKNGIKPIWEVTSKYGYKVRVTPNHKFAQFENGKIVTKSIFDISQSSNHSLLILIPEIKLEKPEALSPEQVEAYFIGVFQGNDCWNYWKNQKVIGETKDVKFFQDWSTRDANKNSFTYIPEFILQGTPDIRASYIAGMMDSSGIISKTKSTLRVRLTTKELSQDVQILLSSLGIPSTLKLERESHGNQKEIYCLGIYDPAAQRRYNQTVGSFTAKLLNKNNSSNASEFGHSLIEVLEAGYDDKDFYYYDSENLIKDPKISLKSLEDNSTSSQFTQTVSDEIVSIIELEEEEETYDLEVEDVHLLSGNGIYTSNSRRGAQLALLDIDHPDIEKFIVAKHTKGRWNNFNVSVGVTEAFMKAVEGNTAWELKHIAKPHPSFISEQDQYQNSNGEWVYKKVPARDIWNAIMENTYDHAEPGIIFLDTINRENPLYYVEKIESTNPCGEVPLPPYGCCDLGPINLTYLVINPFGFKGLPEFDFEKLKQICKTQVRFLDNVLSVSPWPLEEQKREAFSKRRIGVGFTGLGNALAMLCLKYGSQEGREMAKQISETMRDTCYQASVDLAIEKGSFPLFDADKYLNGDFIKRLPQEIRDGIRKHGIRNSLLLSIAPTGTVSLAFCNNASNGIEPPFTWTYDRKKRQQDGSTTINEVSDYSYRLYKELGGDVNNLPSYMQTALELTALEHMQMMEVVQPFIDSAISKTVNIPADYPYEDFKDLYMKAWKAGLKGIATYRPNATLGSVLSVKEDPKVEEKKTEVVELDIKTILEKKVIEKRPKGALPATIEKVEYSNHLGRGRFYLSIGYLPLVENNVEVLRPIEFFLKNLDAESNDQWSESAMRMLSLAARGGFLDRALKDMQKVSWDRGPVRLGETEHVDGHKVPKYHNSESAAVAYAILTSIKNYQKQSKVVVEVEVEKTEEVATQHFSGKICTDCGAAAVIKRDGCSFCENCGLLGSCG